MMWLALALASEGMDALGQGDIARYDGDRPTAREQYRIAADSDDPAARAMAHLRLISMSGNYGILVHGPDIDEALLNTTGSPWDWLALADYYLLLPPSLGGSVEEAERFANAAFPYLPGPALARLYLATRDPEVLKQLRQQDDLDGLGQALVAHDGAAAPYLGTWNLGLGFVGSRELGFGGGVVFVHPDLALQGWALQASVFGTTQRVVAINAAVQGPQTVYPRLSTALQSTPLYVFNEQRDAFDSTRHDLLSLGVGPGLRWGRAGMTLTMTGRLDRVESLGDVWLHGHGTRFTAAWDNSSGWGADRRGIVASGGIDVSAGTFWEGGYPHLGTTGEVKGYWGMLRGTGAARLYGSKEWMDNAPFFRMPSAGGADLHRGAFTWRYRAPWIVAADLEQRWMLTQILEGVVFVNGAWVAGDGPHPGGGAGIRLILPPEHLNVIRLDVAVSDSGWGVWSGFGETF